MNRRVYIFIGLILIVAMHSCSGCSKSGRARLRAERPNQSKPAEKEQRRSLPKESSIEGLDRAAQYKELVKGCFVVYSNNGQGSGFLLKNNVGITNYHVLEGSTNGGFIKDHNGNKYDIIDWIQYSMPHDNGGIDYVVFKFDPKGKKFYVPKISEVKSEIGNKCWAIGSPQGTEFSLFEGRVSNFHPEFSLTGLIQTDCGLEHGSSGGPMFNDRGEVIGVNTLMRFSGDDGVPLVGAQINFFVDINTILKDANF